MLVAGTAATATEPYSGRGYAAGSGPNDLVVVDLDGDGLLDAALPGKTGDHVAVTLGHDDGTFGPVLMTPAGSHPVAIAAGDFDDDGAIDLVTADAGVVLYQGGTYTAVEPTSVSVLMGAGDGSFSPGVPLATGTGPADIVTADINGDASLDLVVSDTIDDQIGLDLGNGNGTFAPPDDYPLGGESATALAVADVDSDGLADLLAVSTAPAVDGGKLIYAGRWLRVFPGV